MDHGIYSSSTCQLQDNPMKRFHEPSESWKSRLRAKCLNLTRSTLTALGVIMLGLLP
jgi:hypothetical protein